MIVGILLAAGAGSRFGGGKLLHPDAEGTPIGLVSFRHLLAALPDSIAVVRGGDEALRAQLTTLGAPVIVCEDAKLGMGHSLAAAVATAASADGWVIALGDMPRIAPQTIARVAQALVEGASIAIPTTAGKRGHPVGLSARFRNDLLQLAGDAGARNVIKANADLVSEVEVNDIGIVADIDTPDDARRLLGGAATKA